MARLLYVVVGVLALVSLAYAQTAVCSFVATTAAVNAQVPLVSGTARFTKTGNTVRVDLNVAGLASNQDYAVHVHQLGDITDLTAGLSVGPHYSTVDGAPHGCPGSSGSNRHTGDMGSWSTDATGTIVQSKSLDLLQLSGSNSIIGRAVVIHANGDDCTTQDPPGNSGNRLAICVIGYNNLSANQTNTASASPSTNYAFATVQLRGTLSNCPACSGTAWFNQLSDGTVQINAKIAGLPFGSAHGFHIHQFGDLTDQNAGTSLGAHWNPDGSAHGVPPSQPRHRGDLGSITAYDNEGFAYYQYQTSYVGDISTLVGRGLVVHQLIDHGAGKSCDATGGSGVRMLTGAIGIAANYKPALPPGGVTINNNWVNATCGSADRIVYSYALGFTSFFTFIWSLFA